MRVLISADMEGVTGVYNRDYVLPEGGLYQRGIELMVGDVNAAVAGAFAGGAKEVWVVDAHHDGTNLPIGRLDPRCQLLGGSRRPLSMVQGVEEAGLLLLVGYHARQGTERAVMDHTYTSRQRLWINGHEVGEVGLNAAIAGHFGVAVGLVTGDQQVGQEAMELLGNVITVKVKEGLGHAGATSLHPERTGEMIFHGAREAVAGSSRFQPWRVERPVQIDLEFIVSELAEAASIYPGSRREGRMVTVRETDMVQAFRAFQCLLALARVPLF